MQRKDCAVDPDLVDSYMRDLQQIQLLHQQSTQAVVDMNLPTGPRCVASPRQLNLGR